MAKTNDTIEGLLAEFRGYSAGMPPSYHVTMSWHDFRQMLDRFGAAHKREAQSIERKPNTDWKDICAKCKEGDIEPKHCEYYGEPNGCNSPIYGEHPTTEKSSVVGNAAAMREALVEIDELCKQAEKDDSKSGQTDADSVPSAPETPVSKRGEVYVLGRHLLVCGDAKVYGDAWVCGDAKVKQSSDYIVMKNCWSSMRWFTYTRSNKKWKVGCFHGTGEELIKKAYADSETSGKCYEAIVRAMEIIETAMKDENTQEDNQ